MQDKERKKRRKSATPDEKSLRKILLTFVGTSLVIISVSVGFGFSSTGDPNATFQVAQAEIE